MPEDIHLCLSDLLDQDLSSQEYFNTLPDGIRDILLAKDDIRSFYELQAAVAELRNRYKDDFEYMS